MSTSGGSSGGGSGIGNDWIGWASLAAVDMVATGIVTWGAYGGEGSPGFALNADTETLDCSATGEYVITLDAGVDYTVGTLDPGGIAYVRVLATTADEGSLVASLKPTLWLPVSPNTHWPAGATVLYGTFTSPPVQFASGDSFVVFGAMATPPTTTGAWSLPMNSALYISKVG